MIAKIEATVIAASRDLLTGSSMPDRRNHNPAPIGLVKPIRPKTEITSD
jgi:hypothetical protein